MIDPQLTCDPWRIEQCLGDSLTDDERAAFESHLEACLACRQALEDRAAAPDDWQAAKQFLSPDEANDNDPSAQELAERRDYAAISGVLSALNPTDDPRMLGRLGSYEIAGVVGSGGMGVVLKGFDSALNRYVAIKVLAPHLAISGAARQRFASSEEVARLLEQCIAHSQQPTAAELPSEVTELVAAQRHESLPLPKGEGRGEGALYLLRRYMLPIAAAFLVMALAVTVKFSIPTEPPSKSPSPLAGEGGVRGQHNEQTLHQAPPWHDDIAPQLIESQAAVHQLETTTANQSPTTSDTLDQEISNLKSQIQNFETTLSTDWK